MAAADGWQFLIFRAKRFRFTKLSGQKREKELAGNGVDSFAGQLAIPTVIPGTRKAWGLAASAVGPQLLFFLAIL
jgi:hypothetical protein